MLKINLLPQEKGRRASSAGSMASMLLVAVVGSLVLLLGGLFLFHASQQSELDEIVATNNRMQSEIDSIKSRVSDHQKILDELAEIRRREEAIQQLQAARTGPTAMLVEISRILSPGGAPTADPAVVDHMTPAQVVPVVELQAPEVLHGPVGARVEIRPLPDGVTVTARVPEEVLAVPVR